MPVDAKYKTTATRPATVGRRRWPTAHGVPARRPQGAWRTGRRGRQSGKLFALGYSACFLGAMRVAAGQTKIKVPDGSTVTATIGIGPRSEGGFGITADLDVYLPGLPEDEAHKLVEVTHTICPYSNATRGNVDVKTTTRA